MLMFEKSRAAGSDDTLGERTASNDKTGARTKLRKFWRTSKD